MFCNWLWWLSSAGGGSLECPVGPQWPPWETKRQGLVHWKVSNEGRVFSTLFAALSPAPGTSLSTWRCFSKHLWHERMMCVFLLIKQPGLPAPQLYSIPGLFFSSQNRKSCRGGGYLEFLMLVEPGSHKCPPHTFILRMHMLIHVKCFEQCLVQSKSSVNVNFKIIIINLVFTFY